MRGVPLIDATGVEALREIWQRQRKGGGNLLLSGLPARGESLVRRSGFLDELGAQRLFWSADQAILSLGSACPPPPRCCPEGDEFDATLIITPHEDRAMQNM